MFAAFRRGASAISSGAATQVIEMSVQNRLLVTMILMLALPLAVTAITWHGLKVMDRSLRQVTEEFAEARSLQPVEHELSDAVVELQTGRDGFEARALKSLRRAESELLRYLADQSETVFNAVHQEDESNGAADELTAIRDLIGPDWASTPTDERVGRVLGIRDGLRRLYRDADTGVMIAPGAAQEARQRTLAYVLTASLVSAVICITLSVWSTRGVILRLRELRRSMAVASEERGTRAPRDVSDVVTDIEHLNHQLTLKIEDKNRELLRRERMAGLGLLAADVAHEINNPMNAMLGLSELSLRATASGPIDEKEREELHESLTVIRREVLRCRGIVQRLMAMVRGGSEPRWLDAHQLLAETVEVASAARPDRAKCFALLGPDRPIQLHAPSEDVRQIMLTLLINAADAVSADGRIEVDATEAEGGEVRLRVRDNGRGFTPETQANFSVPFFTTRVLRGGTGLGLSIAHAIAADIGAEIRSESEGPGRGSLFMLAVPAPEPVA